jgi:uncharacterized protein
MRRPQQTTWVAGASPDADVYCAVLAAVERREQPAPDLPGDLTAAQRLVVGTLRFYQRHVSRHTKRRCIFEPSCSSYALLAVASNGVSTGTREALDRWRRCRPTSAGGPDHPKGCDVPH